MSRWIDRATEPVFVAVHSVPKRLRAVQSTECVSRFISGDRVKEFVEAARGERRR
jgi:hypothetical protein